MRDDKDYPVKPITRWGKNAIMQPTVVLEPLTMDEILAGRKRKRGSSTNTGRASPKYPKLISSVLSINDDTAESRDKTRSTRSDNNPPKLSPPFEHNCVKQERRRRKRRTLPTAPTETRKPATGKLVYSDIVCKAPLAIYRRCHWLADCFTCQKPGPCQAHAPRRIANEHIVCPHVEYPPDDGARYTGPERQCRCNKNELEHIQMGLPRHVRLKESSCAEIGVWATVQLRRGTIIGPYLGEIAPRQLVNGTGKTAAYYRTRGMRKSTPDTCDELPILQFAFKSNWLRVWSIFAVRLAFMVYLSVCLDGLCSLCSGSITPEPTPTPICGYSRIAANCSFRRHG